MNFSAPHIKAKHGTTLDNTKHHSNPINRIARNNTSPKMQPRPYQLDCLAAIEEGFKTFRKQLAVLSTGAGKTCIFSWLAERQQCRTLILAHRNELIDQAIQKLHSATGIKADKEKAEARASMDAQVVVASVQTLIGETRLKRWPSNHFGLVIIDEAHHAISDSFRRVLAHFDGHANVLGVTATPDRGDKKNLGEYFENIAYEIGLFDLIRDGYLSPITVKSVPLQIDLNGVKQTAGDFNDADLGNAIEPYLGQIAEAIAREASFRKTLAFLPLRATSRKFVEACQAIGLSACHIDGESPDRKEILQRFTTGEFDVLSNAMLLCLDMETEILTARGFVKHSELSKEDLVANWNMEGSVFFEPPIEIVKRPLYECEHMVSVDSRTVNFRVTDTHRMIVNAGEKAKGWKKIKANDLRCGHLLPSFGLAVPFLAAIEDAPEKNKKRIISANAYNLRKLNGIPYKDSFIEAEKRYELRASLKYRQPSELTIDECKLIGFWIADGSKTKLKKGGIEYTLCQSSVYPKIINWIDDVIASVGCHSLKKMKHSNENPHFVWSLCRGTGGGCQQRKGVYHLEPYFEKNGTHLFWALNESQFDALVEGYWMGDGHHGQSENGFPKSCVFNDTKKAWIEMLCSIGSVRGWRCQMYHMPSKNPKHKDQWRLRMIKGAKIHISGKTKIVHEKYSPEMVWCVKTTSKNIITRRRGKVTVMGNTEGYDEPSCDCVCVLRPTRSRPLYSQMVGRGTRLHPTKENLLLLDFLWMHEKHSISRPAHLIAKTKEESDAITELANERSAYGQDELDLDDLASDATEKREAALRRKLEEQAKKKAKYVSAEMFAAQHNDMALAEYEPTMKWEGEAITDKQRWHLKRNGIDPDTVKGKGHASRLLSLAFSNQKLQLASPNVVAMIRRMPHIASAVGIHDLETVTSRQGAAFFAELNKRKASKIS